jgi:hypothetical protein
MLTGGELKLDGKQGGSSQAAWQVAACRQQHNSRPQHLVFLWGLTGRTVADKGEVRGLFIRCLAGANRQRSSFQLFFYLSGCQPYRKKDREKVYFVNSAFILKGEPTLAECRNLIAYCFQSELPAKKTKQKMSSYLGKDLLLVNLSLTV